MLCSSSAPYHRRCCVLGDQVGAVTRDTEEASENAMVHVCSVLTTMLINHQCSYLV